MRRTSAGRAGSRTPKRPRCPERRSPETRPTRKTCRTRDGGSKGRRTCASWNNGTSPKPDRPRRWNRRCRIRGSWPKGRRRTRPPTGRSRRTRTFCDRKRQAASGLSNGTPKGPKSGQERAASAWPKQSSQRRRAASPLFQTTRSARPKGRSAGRTRRRTPATRRGF